MVFADKDRVVEGRLVGQEEEDAGEEELVIDALALQGD